MSSSLINPATRAAEELNWARLIPGELPAVRRGQKKGPRAVKSAGVGNVATIQAARGIHGGHDVLKLFVPRPMQSRAAWSWVKATASDFALVELNWLLIGALLVPLRHAFPFIRVLAFDAGRPGSLLGIGLLHAALITLLGYSESLYAGGADSKAHRRILLKSVSLATLLLAVTYSLQAGRPTGLLISMAGILHFTAMLSWRWCGTATQSDSRSGEGVRNVLVIGAGTVGRRVASSIAKHEGKNREFHGFLDNDRPMGDGIIGRVSDLARLARTGFVDEVILAAPHDRELTLQVMAEARRLRLDVEIVPDLFGCQPVADDFEKVGDLPVICVHAERLPAAGLMVKRVIDFAGALVALGLLAPLLTVISLLIKIDSPGPVVYKAKRAGRKGRLFRCFKFRTMVSDADALKNGLRQQNQRSGPFFKLSHDPRITRIGSFLRRYSLDEIPQLWNVVKGEMSLVGPRPHPLDDVAGYEVEHLARLDVTPGITGLWQVTARRDPSFERGMELDREYIRAWSLGMDLRILARTFLAVLRGNGE